MVSIAPISSINAIYSGTMSAAVEAAIESIPSVGFYCLIIALKQILKPARKYAASLLKNY
jgi:5'-nucleotidase